MSMNHRFLHLSLRVGLLLCALLWVVGLRGQTPPCSPTDLFRLEVSKPIVCGTDGALRVVPQPGSESVTVGSYTLDGPGVHKEQLPNNKDFNPLVPGDYTLTIKGEKDGAPFCGTTTAHLDFTPFQAHVTEIVPPPSSSPERLSPPKSRASFVKDGTDYNMGRLVLRTVHGRGQHLMRYWIESYTPVAGVTPQALPPIGSRDTPFLLPCRNTPSKASCGTM